MTKSTQDISNKQFKQSRHRDVKRRENSRRGDGYPQKRTQDKPEFNPNIDRRLKKVLAEIGVPPRDEFVPDPFQLEALKVLEFADCLVSAPTGSGKTWIAEQAIRKHLAAGQRVWYACPLKALSNSKFAEFGGIFGKDNVGILTGDRKLNAEAPLIVGTTEILRNQLYDAMHRGSDLRVDFVIMDEAHYLGDEDRGVVWEEILIYLPARIPLLLLSATIGNAAQVASWLRSIRERDCKVVLETKRPVPLYPMFMHPKGTLYPLRNAKGNLDHTAIQFIVEQPPRRFGRDFSLPIFGDIIKLLRKYNLLPAIFFMKSRADCDKALTLAQKNRQPSEERKAKIRDIVLKAEEQFPRIGHHKQLWDLENLAIAAHHSGQLPSWKLLVEELLSQGLLDAVFATSTVAAGVNFPARTVVLLNSDRFNGQEFVSLSATDLSQMTGRAGRRGMDKIGFAVCLTGPFMDLEHIAEVFGSKPSPIESRIHINFSMALNLLLSHSPEQIEDLLQKSFATWQLDRKNDRYKDGSALSLLVDDFHRHMHFLTLTGFVTENGKLTTDGFWASKLRVDQPLLIAEGFRKKVFPAEDPVLLAAMFASLVNERETDDENIRQEVPPALREAFHNTVRGLSDFAVMMLDYDFNAYPLYFRPAWAIYAWMNNAGWDTVLRLSHLEEGDLVSLILRTADNLRHVRALKEVFPIAAASASAALEIMLRPPVVAEDEIPNMEAEADDNEEQRVL